MRSRLLPLLLLPLTLTGCGSDSTDITTSASTTAATTAAQVSAQAFLARGGFLGQASLTDRAIGGNRFLVYHARLDEIPTDTNNIDDIYVRDLRLGQTTLVSVDSNNAPANGPSTQASISADGRYVVFRSAATNLVANDTNNVDDIFMRDLKKGLTTRVSVATGGAQLNGPSITPAVSSNGQYVVFASTHAGPNDSNERQDIFATTIATGATTLVSTNAANTSAADGASHDPAISADGSQIAFSTDARNIIAGSLNGQRQVVRVARVNPASRVLISESLDGAQAQGPCYEPSLSNDGDSVAFFTSSNLDGTDTNGLFDVYVARVTPDTLTRASVSTTGAQSNGHSGFPSISADGSIVSFGSVASNLVTPATASGVFQIFSRDAAITEIASVQGNTRGNLDSDLPAISLDGRYVAFRSTASNLSSQDLSPDDDIYARDRRTPTTVLQSPGFTSSTTTPIFSTETEYAAGGFVQSLVSGDLNGDLLLDIVAINPYSTSADPVDPEPRAISILFNNGDGTFTLQNGPLIDNDNDAPYAGALADLDNDSTLDLVTADRNAYSATLYPNDGSGIFQTATRNRLQVGVSVNSVALGDLNDDSFPDIVLAGLEGDDGNAYAYVSLTNATGQRGPFAEYPIDPEGEENWVALGDTDNDRDLDIVAGSDRYEPAQGGVTVLTNNDAALGTFTFSQLLENGTYPAAIATADLDRDNRADIVVGNGDDKSVTAFLYDVISGAFKAPPVRTSLDDSSPTSIAVGDINADGWPDVVTANGCGCSVFSLSVLLNDRTGKLPTSVNTQITDIANAVTLGDFDGDGDLDAATGNSDEPNISVLMNNARP